MRHVLCPNESCGAANYVEDELWHRVNQPGSLAGLACNRCDTVIPPPNAAPLRAQLTNGWWSMGNGGHVIRQDAAGEPYPERVTPDEPSRILGPLPFLILRADRVYSENYVPPLYYPDIPVQLYGDCRDELLDGVAYKAWYKKRIVYTDSESIQLNLNEHEIREVLFAAKKMYGDDSYACISEVLTYNHREQFVHRMSPNPVSVGAFVGVTFDLT